MVVQGDSMEPDPPKGDTCEVEGGVLTARPSSGEEGVTMEKGKNKQGGKLYDDECISLKDLMAAAKVAPSSSTPRKKEHRSRGSGKDSQSEHTKERKKRKRTTESSKLSTPAKKSRNKHKGEVPKLELIENMLYDQRYSVKVQVLRLWHGQLYGQKYGDVITFIGMDEQKKRIEFHIPESLTSKWKANLEEHRSYLISNVRLSQSDKQTKLIDRPHQLMFDELTTASDLDPESLPHSPLYKFRDLCELPTLNLAPNTLRDFILFIADIDGPNIKFRRNSKESFRVVDVYVLDKSSSTDHVLLTMWEETFNFYADHFAKGIREQFVVAATGLKTNEYDGKLGLKTTSFTRFEFNPEIAKARQLYRCIVDAYSKTKVLNLSSKSAQPQSAEAFAEQVMTINQLNQQGNTLLPPGKVNLQTTTWTVIGNTYT